MYDLNNLDIAILVIVLISGLIALNRGLIKEVLSIVGWFLSTAVIVYALPVCLPFAKKYIQNGIIAGIATSLIVFIVFFVIWIYSTSSIIGKIRTSKLNGLDRFLGLFFGVMRAFLLIILVNIMISWIISADNQPEILEKSKYYKIAGNFAKPLENMIPQETLKLIKDKTAMVNTDDSPSDKNENDILFEKLSQPKVKKAIKEVLQPEIKGYKEKEREDLERLLDSVNGI